MRSAPGTTPAAEASTSSPRAEAAKDEAREIGQEGADAGRHVADTAKDEAKSVADEATGQAKNLVHTLQDELNDQASTQQKRAAESLHSISDELRSMADHSEQRGMATQWVQEAAGRMGSAASWLDQRDPASVLEETKRFARNRPGAFLAIAAGAGLVAGRLARSLKDNSSDTPRSSTGSAPSRTGPSSSPAAPPHTGDSRRDPFEGGVRDVERPDDALATPVPGYPSQAPGYPANSPGGAPAQAEPTFPEDGARGLT